MRCYYEVLDVAEDADSDQIKKAYRKLSLKYHPDKNADDAENATRIFQEILEAFKVLSDPQERAWYDGHREQILSGGNYEDDSVNVFIYFSASCFTGYDDGPKSFYTVYSEVFAAIAKEELKAAATNVKTQRDGHHDIDQLKQRYPVFGSSNSNFADVVSVFYAQWEAFSTKRNFHWVEKYDTRHGDCRMERRAMESENKRLRESAKKERNEQVRELVKFVKKRDKRVSAEKERLALKAQEDSKRIVAMAKARRKKEAEKLEAAWAAQKDSQWHDDFEEKLQELEDDFEALECDSDSYEDDSDISDPIEEVEDEDASPRKEAKQVTAEESTGIDDEDEDAFRCIACSKSFTSAGQLKNHEASRAHVKKLEKFKSEMREEDAKLFATSTAPAQTTKPQEDDFCRTKSKAAKKKEAHAQAELSNVLLSCSVCSKRFPNRNALFQHIREEGHADAKVTVSAKVSKAKKRLK